MFYLPQVCAVGQILGPGGIHFPSAHHTHPFSMHTSQKLYGQLIPQV